MKVRAPTEHVVARARALIADAGVRTPRDIDVEAIAARQGAFVLYGPSSTAAGNIVRAGRSAIVWVDEATRGAPRGRFTTAHELGHFVLHTSEDHFEHCASSTRTGTSFRIEREADEFAAELLAPEPLAAPMCRAERPTLDDVDAMARAFRLSLEASVIRYVQLATAPCAAVMVERGRIRWATETASFPGRIVQRRAVHHASIAAALASSARRTGERVGTVAGEVWGATRAMSEHAIRAGRDGEAVLSFVVAQTR